LNVLTASISETVSFYKLTLSMINYQKELKCKKMHF